MSSSSSRVVTQFFTAFGKGDLEGVVATFDPGATLIAVRSGPHREGQVYGTYTGAAGVREFVGNLGGAFETKAFTVDVIVGDGEVAFAKGAFVHTVRKTGKTFQSDWALMCRVRGERIVEYRFFEDSAALVAADPSTALAP